MLAGPAAASCRRRARQVAAHARFAPKLLLLLLSLLGASAGAPMRRAGRRVELLHVHARGAVAFEYQAIQRWPALSSAMRGE